MTKVASSVQAAKRSLADGNPREAERLFRAALAKGPSDLGAICGLCALLLELARTSEALDVVARPARVYPRNHELQTLLGQCLFAAGRLPEATVALEAAARSAQPSVNARIWLAKCRAAANRTQEAGEILRAVLDTHSANPDAHGALARVCVQLGRGPEALGHYRDAARIRPGADERCDLGFGLYINHQTDEALSEFEAALKINPRLVSAICGKAKILADRGQREDARGLIHDALDAGILDPALATTYAQLSGSREQRAQARAVIQRMLVIPNVPPLDRSSLLMALGTLVDADGEYDRAFHYFRAGNDLIYSPLDESVMRRNNAQIMRVFSPEAMPDLPRSPDHDPLPVFIVGMPRSGTSLVEQILASHPSVFGAGELNDVTAMVRAMPTVPHLPPGSDYPSCIPLLSPGQLAAIARPYLNRLRALGGSAVRACDKMPHNYHHLGLIDLLFPGARVIHCRRHPMDTNFSCYTTPLHDSHAYRTRFRSLVAVYRAYRGLMDHWRPLLRIPMLEVDYEDVVSAPERMARRIVEFIGLPWDDRCLKFHENRRTVLTASKDQVRRPIYSSSVGRWKRYERHLGELAGLLSDFL